MRQVIQRLDNGVVELLECPVPTVRSSGILVRTAATLVSAGTERMLVEFGRASIVSKARQQPDRLMQVLAKMRTDGVASTLDAVRSKLATPIPLGYCHAGVVVAVGSAVQAFSVGDRVVTNGGHSEVVAVPWTLAARIPDTVSDEAAAFTPLAAVALQGLRLAGPSLGETVVVYGLGLVGLLAVQLARASGCRVIGVDRDETRLRLARQFGALTVDSRSDSVVEFTLAQTRGLGADVVLLTLSSASDVPVQDSARMARQRGRIVLVGVSGLQLQREEFFQKELSFSVSCSYGPGRYDASYEEFGQDYPAGFVRWTAQRNFDAVLAAIGSGGVDPLPLISHRVAFDEAPRAYDLVVGPAPSLGIVLQYSAKADATVAARPSSSRRQTSGLPRIGFIGAGNFVTRTLLPLFEGLPATLQTIAASSGRSAAIAARQFGIRTVCSSASELLNDPNVDAVIIASRHDSHAALTVEALRAGKHVLVEKPLALTEESLDEIELVARESDVTLTVGFNRRFAPLTSDLKRLLAARGGPLAVTITVNAGAIPADHWTQNPLIGGGRFVGEGCHFVDLARHLVGSPIASARSIFARLPDGGRVLSDVATAILGFADGSIASIQYLSVSSAALPKERVECSWDGRSAVIENWRRLRRHDRAAPFWSPRRKMDKGHSRQLSLWLDSLRNGGQPLVPLSELVESSRWTLRLGRPGEDG